MDVDGPSNLKRSSSAPMINELNNISTSLPSRPHSPRGDGGVFNVFAAALPRTRRFSASCSSSSPLAQAESPKLSSARVTQLRREERLEAVHGRELEHERELHCAMQMSQSCEDLALLPSLSNSNGSKDIVMGLSSPSSPVGSGILGSFSPTRDRATPTRTHALPCLLLRRPLSPSPTRKTFMSRRSLSPIAMRPSALTPVKRKFELDHSDSEHMGSPGSSSSSSYLSPPAKRLSVGTSLAFGPDGQRSAPLSPGGGRFLFRPLPSVSQVVSASSSPSQTGGGAHSGSSSSRDEPMLDEEEEEMQLGARHKTPSTSETPPQQQQQNTIKDTVMASIDPS